MYIKGSDRQCILVKRRVVLWRNFLGIISFLKNEQSMRDLKIEYRNYNEVIKLFQ